jgi:hypothetical protein
VKIIGPKAFIVERLKSLTNGQQVQLKADLPKTNDII